MPFKSEIESAGETGGTGADDDDLLAGRRLGDQRRLLVMHPLVVGGHPFEDHDTDRFVNEGASAGLFAGMGADAAADRRDRHVATDGAEGCVEAEILDLFDVGGDVNVGRTAVHTGSSQLLLVGLGRRQLPLTANIGEIVGAIVLDRIENRHDRGHAQGTFTVLQEIGHRGDGV